MRRAIAAAIRSVGSREFRFTAVTARQGRDGHVLVPQGLDLTNYKKNPVILWQHRAENPVARCTGLSVIDGELRGGGEFPPAGGSPLADEVCSLVKSGVVSAVSVGFDLTDSEPLDPKRPHGGQRITRSELLEISLVSVPADTGAVISERAYRRAGMINPDYVRRRAEVLRLALGSVPLSRAERLAEVDELWPRARVWHRGSAWCSDFREQLAQDALERFKQAMSAPPGGDPYSYAYRQSELRRLARAG